MKPLLCIKTIILEQLWRYDFSTKKLENRRLSEKWEYGTYKWNIADEGVEGIISADFDSEYF